MLSSYTRIQDTGGGDFVGRDRITNAASAPGNPASNLDRLMLKLEANVALKVGTADVDQALAQVTVMHAELAKGKEADDQALAWAVQALLAVAPDAVVAALSDPIIVGKIGPVTQYVLTRHSTG